MTAPIILFGAFDRHNFGDMLFPHIVASVLDQAGLVHAGLIDRDLRPWGGHRVHAISRLAAEWGDRPARVIHTGGEILTCTAYQAAVMLSTPEVAEGAIRAYDHDLERGFAWAQAQLHLHQHAPYTVPRSLFRNPDVFVYNSVGGVELGTVPPTMQAEVIEKLRTASHVSVRDHATAHVLAASGVRASVAPDPVVMVEEYFGSRIRQHAQAGEVAALRDRFHRGYLACQFSADFGDDATLAILARELQQVAAETDLALVFFRAGSAPWHDALEPYQRLANRLDKVSSQLFQSLNLWDICALIAHSRAFCGSSLHGRIVAMAFGIPRINVQHPGDGTASATTKQTAYASTWEHDGILGAVAPDEVAMGVMQALAAPQNALAATAERLRSAYRNAAARWESLVR
jgi:hypothetical protein